MDSQKLRGIAEAAIQSKSIVHIRCMEKLPWEVELSDKMMKGIIKKIDQFVDFLTDEKIPDAYYIEFYKMVEDTVSDETYTLAFGDIISIDGIRIWD